MTLAACRILRSQKFFVTQRSAANSCFHAVALADGTPMPPWSAGATDFTIVRIEVKRTDITDNACFARDRNLFSLPFIVDLRIFSPCGLGTPRFFYDVLIRLIFKKLLEPCTAIASLHNQINNGLISSDTIWLFKIVLSMWLTRILHFSLPCCCSDTLICYRQQSLEVLNVFLSIRFLSFQWWLASCPPLQIFPGWINCLFNFSYIETYHLLYNRNQNSKNHFFSIIHLK